MVRGEIDPVDEGLTTHRLEALSDGIFAFAMTLLVLDLKIEKIPEAVFTPGLLGHELRSLLPKAICYVASFFQLGVFWIGHHAFSHFIKRADRPFLWITLLFLCFIVLVPFSTDLLGDYPNHKLAVSIYGINMLALGCAIYWIWAYATRDHRLVGHELEEEVVALGKRRILRGVISYTLALFVTTLAPSVSLIIYILVPLSYVLTSRIDTHWTHSHG